MQSLHIDGNFHASKNTKLRSGCMDSSTVIVLLTRAHQSYCLWHKYFKRCGRLQFTGDSGDSDGPIGKSVLAPASSLGIVQREVLEKMGKLPSNMPRGIIQGASIFRDRIRASGWKPRDTICSLICSCPATVQLSNKEVETMCSLLLKTCK